MVKVVQIVGGPASVMDIFVGSDRQLGVVTDTHELRIFDGIKIGGFRLLAVEANDLKYSTKSEDIDAIAAIADQVGFLVRRGDGNFIYRTLTQGPDIVITNGAGVNGVPTIALSSTISQALTFQQVITAANGLAGNVTGNLTGNVTGNVTGDSAGTHTGNVVGNVTGDLTGDSTGNHTGGADVRGATLALDDGQILAAKINPVPATGGDPSNTFIAGMIQLWFGSIASIPTGWIICNGAGGTPDLRDIIVIGAGGIYSPADTPGALNHDHGTLTSDTDPAHTHVFTGDSHALSVNEIPSLQFGTGVGLKSNDESATIHGTQAAVGSGATDNFDTGGSEPTLEPLSEPIGGGSGHIHTGSNATAGAHSHQVPTAANPASNLQPSHALAYIMKT